MYSVNGYRRYSRDVDNAFNIIPSGRISMKGVDFPVIGVDEFGIIQFMQPEKEYQFPGNTVFEVPIMERGGWLPSRDKIKATLNPKNWGVPDYSDKGSRGAAYAAARKAGEKEFMWNNQRFNTKYDGTSEQQLKETGITDKQIGTTRIGKNLANNLYPAGYSTSDHNSINKSKISSLKRVYDAGILNKIEPDRFDADDAINYPEDNPHFKGIIEQRYKDRIDYNNLYFGLPQKYNTKRISKYKPSNSKDNNSVEYYTSDLIQQRLEGLLAFNEEFKRSVQPGDNSNTGSYTLDSGEDDRGKYYSFYDKWDLSPFGTGKDESLGIGKPVEIYDRIYYKDYGDGKKKRMYYTDKELSELDPNKRNFDTLALQRELSNRGYKLPKSTKQDGTFDGIWGDETKNALLDWQNKNLRTSQQKYQQGGGIPPIFVDSPDDPRYRAYQDSLNLYKTSEIGRKTMSDELDWIKYSDEVIPYDKLKKHINKIIPPGESWKMGQLIHGKYTFRNINKDEKVGSYEYCDNIEEYESRTLPIKPIGWKAELNYGEKYDPEKLYIYHAVYKKPEQPVFVKGTPQAINAEKQIMLKEQGLYSGKIDGDWGRLSKAAWRKYQDSQQTKDTTPPAPVIQERPQKYYTNVRGVITEVDKDAVGAMTYEEAVNKNKPKKTLSGKTWGYTMPRATTAQDRALNYQQGGTVGMDGMMKARLALDSHFGNPTARRMTNYDTRNYKFDDGSVGNVYVSSYDNLVTPHIQLDENNNLIYVDDVWSDNNKERSYQQSMKFEREEDAEYFGKNYKRVAPMKKLYQDGGYIQEEDPTTQLLYSIAEALQQGSDPREVLNALKQNGVPEEQAMELIKYVMEQMQQQDQLQKEEKQQLEYAQDGKIVRKYNVEDLDWSKGINRAMLAFNMLQTPGLWHAPVKHGVLDALNAGLGLAAGLSGVGLGYSKLGAKKEYLGAKGLEDEDPKEKPIVSSPYIPEGKDVTKVVKPSSEIPTWDWQTQHPDLTAKKEYLGTKGLDTDTIGKNPNAHIQAPYMGTDSEKELSNKIPISQEAFSMIPGTENPLYNGNPNIQGTSQYSTYTYRPPESTIPKVSQTPEITAENMTKRPPESIKPSNSGKSFSDYFLPDNLNQQYNEHYERYKQYLDNAYFGEQLSDFINANNDNITTLKNLYPDEDLVINILKNLYPDEYLGIKQDGGYVQEEDPTTQLLYSIAEALQQGSDPREILNALKQNGVPEEQAMELIKYVMEQMQQQDQLQKEEKQQLEYAQNGKIWNGNYGSYKQYLDNFAQQDFSQFSKKEQTNPEAFKITFNSMYPYLNKEKPIVSSPYIPEGKDVTKVVKPSSEIPTWDWQTQHPVSKEEQTKTEDNVKKEETKQTFYTGDPYGMLMANNALIGFQIFNDYLSDKDYEREYNRRMMQIGNSNAKYNPVNYDNPYGTYTPNVGIGSNYGLVANGPIQDFGTGMFMAEEGGRLPQMPNGGRGIVSNKTVDSDREKTVDISNNKTSGIFGEIAAAGRKLIREPLIGKPYYFNGKPYLYNPEAREGRKLVFIASDPDNGTKQIDVDIADFNAALNRDQIANNYYQKYYLYDKGKVKFGDIYNNIKKHKLERYYVSDNKENAKSYKNPDYYTFTGKDFEYKVPYGKYSEMTQETKPGSGFIQTHMNRAIQKGDKLYFLYSSFLDDKPYIKKIPGGYETGFKSVPKVYAVPLDSNYKPIYEETEIFDENDLRGTRVAYNPFAKKKEEIVEEEIVKEEPTNTNKTTTTTQSSSKNNTSGKSTTQKESDIMYNPNRKYARF